MTWPASAENTSSSSASRCFPPCAPACRPRHRRNKNPPPSMSGCAPNAPTKTCRAPIRPTIAPITAPAPRPLSKPRSRCKLIRHSPYKPMRRPKPPNTGHRQPIKNRRRPRPNRHPCRRNRNSPPNNRSAIKFLRMRWKGSIEHTIRTGPAAPGETDFTSRVTWHGRSYPAPTSIHRHSIKKSIFRC